MSSFLAGSNISQGTSDTARYVDWQSGEARRRLVDSISLGLGKTGVFEELWDVSEQCGVKGWDGDSAAAVSLDTYRSTFNFLESLPVGTEAPAVGAEPDGHITLEWHVHPRRTLSVSVSPEGELHYAALLGASKYFGTEPFFGEPPKTIIDLILRIISRP